MTTVLQPFLSAVGNRWSEVALVLAERGARSELRSSGELGKMVIDIECPTHVALVEAWEHAQCLDVTVLHLASGESTILSAGPCSSEKEIDIRFLALRTALLKNEQN